MWRRGIRNDPLYKHVIHKLQDKEIEQPYQRHSLVRRAHELFKLDDNGILLKKVTARIGRGGNTHLLEEWRIVVPECMIHEVLWFHHDHFTAGHVGTEKMTLQIQKRYWWHRLTKDIEQ